MEGKGMRILLEIDDRTPAVVTTAGAVAATVLAEAADGGAGPGGAASPSFDADAGAKIPVARPSGCWMPWHKTWARAGPLALAHRPRAMAAPAPHRRKPIPRRTER